MLGQAVLLGVLLQLASIPISTHTTPAAYVGDGERALRMDVLRLRGGMAKLTEAQRQEVAEKKRREAAKERKKRKLPAHYILVPDDIRRIWDVVEKVCGEYRRLVDYPEPSPSGYIDPYIDEFNEATLVEWGQWYPGTGQPVFVRWGEYKWGVWSERRDTFRDPSVLVLNGKLEMYGEDGTVLVGPWLMMEDSHGIFKEMLLYSDQQVPGRGSGLTMHFCGGNWTIQYCQLQVTPGPQSTVIAMCREANITLDWCHVSKMRCIDVRTWAYGIDAWDRAKLRADNVTFWSLKVCVIASDRSELRFDDCELDNSRFGVYLHEDAKIWMNNSNITEIHRACFVSGRRPKRKGQELHLQNMFLSANGEMWQDADRPDNFTFHGEIDEKTPSPTCFWGTDAEILGLPGGWECPNATAREQIEYRRQVVHNFTMLRPTMMVEDIDWSYFDVYNGSDSEGC